MLDTAAVRSPSPEQPENEPASLAEPSTDQVDGDAHPKIWGRFKHKNLVRLLVIEDATVAALEQRLELSEREEANQAAKGMSESLRTFGFIRGSRMSQEMQQILETTGVLEPTQIHRLCEVVVILRSELESPPHTEGETPTPEFGRSSILIVDSDRDSAERLTLEATARGLRAEAADNLAAARGAAERLRPDAVLLDLDLGDALDGGATLLEELSSMVPPIPVVVLSCTDTLQDRVRVASLGGEAFLRKPLPPSEVLDAVTEMLASRGPRKGSVLVVDDNPKEAKAVRAALEAENIEVHTLTDPRRFWDALQRSSPDLLLLDMDMPHFSGVELCQAVRSDQRWRGLPVLFMAPDHSVDSVNRVFAARADDYVRKPIVAQDLAANVLNRLERADLHRRVDTDLLTGVANRRKATHVLSKFLHLAQKSEKPLSFAIMHLDDFGLINERYGHVAGDSVLHRFAELLVKAMRTEDLIARWGGGEFVVALYGMNRNSAAERLESVLHDLRAERFVATTGSAFHATCSGSIVEYPQDGTDLQTLYHKADEVIHRVKVAGGNRVVPEGWQAHQGNVQRVNVAIIDNDESLASLLVHAMEMRGYSARWLRDGDYATRVLTGDPPSLRAGVVLLDVDLPGLDGYDLLRDLKGKEATAETQVIVLTNRSHEREVLKSLELGAFDHIFKPFSLPVLVERIRRAMGD